MSDDLPTCRCCGDTYIGYECVDRECRTILDERARLKPGIAKLLYVIDRLYEGGAWRSDGDISAAHDEAAEILGDLMEPEGELHD